MLDLQPCICYGFRKGQKPYKQVVPPLNLLNGSTAFQLPVEVVNMCFTHTGVSFPGTISFKHKPVYY